LVIDIFCHIAPKKFLNQYVKTQLPQLLRFLDAGADSAHGHFVDEDARIKVMDKYGIDLEVLSLQPSTMWDSVKDQDLLRLTRQANDAMAEVVGKHKDRMLGIATLPMLAGGEFLDELDRAIRDLGMKGCEVFSNVRGKPLDSPEFIPFFEKMSKYDLPILLHPTNWQYYEWIGDYRLIQIFGWPFDTSLAMARLVFGGVMFRFPNLKIVTHHLGGMVPHFAERIRTFYDEAMMHPETYGGTRMFPYAEKMNKHPLEFFKLFYADTVENGGLSTLKCGLDFFGSDHVVFATDYPFGPKNGEVWTEGVLQNMKDIDISDQDKQKIFEENSRKLLKLD
jgi:aminocarboxymuconate-semialdehyde decarboxylase